MEAFLVLVLLLSSSCTLGLLPAFSQARVMPLRPNWSFSADLSLDSPLPVNAYSSPSLSLFTPILSSFPFSSGKGFSLGFYSLFSSSSSPLPTSIFLTVCLGTNKTDAEGRAFAVPIWHYNRSRPLKQVGKGGLVSLSVNSISRELILRDGDGSVVFTVRGAEAMEMQNDGNWVVYNARNKVIWQSFDHPSDTLLQGQYLKLGMKLQSNNSLYTAEMMHGGVVFYCNVKAPAFLTYWAVPSNITVVQYIVQHAFELSKNPSVNLTHSFEHDVCPALSPRSPPPSPPTPYAFFLGSNFSVMGDCSSYQWSSFSNIFQNSTLPSDFLVLDDDGYPKGYTYLHILDKNLLFSGQANSSYCMSPLACGSYGICNELLFGLQHSCTCPSVLENQDFQGAFTHIDLSDPSQGCRRTVPLQCSDDAGLHSLVQIKQSSFISIHPVYETTYMHNTLSLPECIARCEHNCSCSGFFHHEGSNFCLPFSDNGTGWDMPPLTFIAMQSSDFSTYIKIQQPSGESGVHSDRPVPSRGRSHLSKAIVLMVVGGVLLLILLMGAIAALFTYKHMNRLKDIDDEEMEAGDSELIKVVPMLPKRYSYKELEKATGGFSIQNEIGFGGFGRVYQAILPDGRKLAVKKLGDHGSLRLKQFLAEIAIIRDVGHFNVVPLRGFCSRKPHRLLVYEFMENGSLDKWLFSDSDDLLLDWNKRYQIALGVARGLAYLHEECPMPIIHFDVKPQNILLDKEFVAKISDFGLCKLVGRAESSCIMTGIRGTPGYLAPEWLLNTGVGKKCDVYSYGMVVLEMVGGRKNAMHELLDTEQWYFPMWAAMLCKQGRYKEVVDRRLKGIYVEEQVKRAIHVAFLCIQRDPSLRPSMGCVCKMIEGSLPLDGEEFPTLDLALRPLSPLHPSSSSSHTCASTLLVGR